MIYKDKLSIKDLARRPAARSNELCLNCGYEWGNHHDWTCPNNLSAPRSFSRKHFRNQYCTQSMKDSLDPNLKCRK
jgi:hypothetical protein